MEWLAALQRVDHADLVAVDPHPPPGRLVELAEGPGRRVFRRAACAWTSRGRRSAGRWPRRRRLECRRARFRDSPPRAGFRFRRRRSCRVSGDAGFCGRNSSARTRRWIPTSRRTTSGISGWPAFFAMSSKPRCSTQSVPVRVSWPSGNRQTTSPCFNALMISRIASSGWSRRMVMVSKMPVKTRMARCSMKTSSITKRTGRGQAAEMKNASA